MASALVRTSTTAQGKQIRIGAFVSTLSLVGTLAAQLALPRVLLPRWGDGGYALYVAVTGLVSYLILADAGVQLYLIQRLTLLRSTGQESDAEELARGGLRTLIALALVGLVVLSGIFLALEPHLSETVVHAGASVTHKGILLAFFVQAAACGFTLATGGWSTAMEQASGHYVRTHAFGLVRYVSVTGTQILLAALGAAAPTTLIASTLPGLVLDITRFGAAFRLAPWPATV